MRACVRVRVPVCVLPARPLPPSPSPRSSSPPGVCREHVLLRAIRARPELGLYALYTRVDAGLEGEAVDTVVRISEARPVQ